MTIYAAAYNTFLDSPWCAVLTWTGRWHSGFRGQILSSKSGILWIYRAFKTTGNSWWHHWSSGRSSRKRPYLQFRVGWPFKTCFPSRSLFIPEFPVVLNSLKSSFHSPELTVVSSTAQIMLYWQHRTFWMFIILNLEKSLLKPVATLGAVFSKKRPRFKRDILSRKDAQLCI